MLVLLTIFRAPRSFARRQTISCASAASRAQCTCAPRLSAFATNCSRYLSRLSSTSSLMARASVRKSCQFGNPLAAASRRVPNRDVALRKAPRNCTSSRAARALASKVSVVKWHISLRPTYLMNDTLFESVLGCRSFRGGHRPPFQAWLQTAPVQFMLNRRAVPTSKRTATQDKLKCLGQLLRSQQFCQVHRSYARSFPRETPPDLH